MMSTNLWIIFLAMVLIVFVARLFWPENEMKLRWNILRDGWTSVRQLYLLDKKGKVIWMSEKHWHGVNKAKFEEDFKFLVDKYGIDENSKCNIEEIVTEGRVT